MQVYFEFIHDARGIGYMKKNVKIIVIVFMLVMAINITVIMIGFAGKSSEPAHTPGPSFSAMVTPTTEPPSTDTSDQTPDETASPSATPTSTQTGSATPTATSTSSPTQSPTPTQTSVPTETPSGGGGGGGGTQPTPAPTPTQTPTTIVSIATVSQINKDGTFTVDININNVTYMAYAFFDLKFNSNYISYTSCNSNSQIGDGTGSVSASTIQPGLVRIIVSYSSYANAHGGYGVSGSGYLCKLNFEAIAQGTSQMEFVEEQGELTLISWVDCDQYETCTQSEIANVGWTNSSITVVN